MLSHRRGQFKSRRRVAGRAVRHWHDAHESGALTALLKRQHDHKGPIIKALFPACLMFSMPKVCVGKNEAELRFRKRHTRADYSLSSSAFR